MTTVTPIRRAPRARRARASLARALADAAGLRGTERELFALLIRLSYAPGAPVARRRAWLAEHLAVHPVTVVRAVNALERAGLVTVARGSGRSTSTYTLDLEALVTRLTPAVQPSELTPGRDDEGLQIATPGVANCYPSGSETQPQGLQVATSLRARDARDARETPDSYQYPLTPWAEPQRAAAGDAGGRPPGTPPHPKCHHGRTVCRICGTTPRAQARQAAREAAEQERAERQRSRAIEAATAAAEHTGAPPDFRALFEHAREESPT